MADRSDVLFVTSDLGKRGVGAAFLVKIDGPGAILLTALHNVARIEDDEIRWAKEVTFASAPRVGDEFGKAQPIPLGPIVDYDPWQDWVAYEVATPEHAQVHELGELRSPRGRRWESYGFPDPKGRPGGSAIAGAVESTGTPVFRSHRSRQTRFVHLQLNANALGTSVPRGARGYSGGPVLVGQHVVGLITRRDVSANAQYAEAAVGGTLYAIPSGLIVKALRAKGVKVGVGEIGRRATRFGFAGKLALAALMVAFVAMTAWIVSPSAPPLPGRVAAPIVESLRAALDVKPDFRFEFKKQVVVVGSGTVLWGFLDPLRAHLEMRCGISIPVSKDQDHGSTRALDLVRRGNGDIAAMSSRSQAEIRDSIDYVGKAVIEVIIGFDESQVFVNDENPLTQMGIGAVQRDLCCAHDDLFMKTVTWGELGVPPGHSLASEQVRWYLPGRDVNDPKKRGDDSSTVFLAESWLCAPVGKALCRTVDAKTIYLHEIPVAVSEDHKGLGLSAKSFAVAGSHAVDIVDSEGKMKLGTKKALWLYYVNDADKPLPEEICRFFDAILSEDVSVMLREMPGPDGLNDDQRIRQREALGLDGGGCGRQPTWGLPVGWNHRRSGVWVKSSAASDVVEQRDVWVPIGP